MDSSSAPSPARPVLSRSSRAALFLAFLLVFEFDYHCVSTAARQQSYFVVDAMRPLHASALGRVLPSVSQMRDEARPLMKQEQRHSQQQEDDHERRPRFRMLRDLFVHMDYICSPRCGRSTDAAIPSTASVTAAEHEFRRERWP